MEVDFEKELQWTSLGLLLSGINVSNIKQNKFIESFLNHHLFYFNFIALYSVIIGEIYWVIDGIATGKKFGEISLISPCITISILGTVKALFLLLNRDVLKGILCTLDAIHLSGVNFECEYREFDLNKTESIVTKSMKLLAFVRFLLFLVCLIVFCTFSFAPLIIMAYDYYKTGDWVIAYPFFVKYFFDVYNTRWSCLIYFHQVWATLIVVINLFGCDTLYYSLCVHIHMNFQLLGLQFENIVTPSVEETRRKLAKAITRHQLLMHLVNQTEKLYSKSSLYNIVSSSFLICLSAFNITVAEEISRSVAFMTFLLMSFSQISLLCYFGDMLMRSSTDISMSVYNSFWFNADAGIKKTLLLVIVRSQRACKLTAWSFADLNLRAFTTILSRSWSYFALLKTVYK